MKPPTPSRPSQGAVVLNGIGWGLYSALRDAGSDRNRRVKMTYDRGVLELMAAQSRLHERIYKLLGRMVQVWTEEADIPMSSGGQTTLRREDLNRGVEPDESFHIQNESAVRAVDDLRLPDDPPPDLVLEVDVTNSYLPRLPIFAALGVPEVWRWHDGELLVLRRDGDSYLEHAESIVLPGFPIEEARRLLLDLRGESETALIRRFRSHVRRSLDDDSNREVSLP